MDIELSRWRTLFASSFEKQSGLDTFSPSAEATKAIQVVNDSPDAIWLLPFEDRILLLPFLFLREDRSPIVDRSEILRDYLLMMLTPQEISDSRYSWWQYLTENLTGAQHRAIEEALDSWEQWDVDDLRFPGYPGWELREAYWREEKAQF
jgi:hypothetical protein